MDDLQHLQNILNLFGLEFHSCKFESKELPKLVLVVNPTVKDNSVPKVKSDFQSLPAVAFNVSIISGVEYCGIAAPDMPKEERSDINGWNLFEGKGYCAYDSKEKTVYIGYPYQSVSLPIERAIVHELGHYKQDVLFDARFIEGDNDNNTILEYHNIMVNENRLCSKDIEKSIYWWNGYRIGYGTIKKYADNRSASSILIGLLDKNFSKKIKLLINRMLEIAKEVEVYNNNNNYNKEVISKLVQNMNSQLQKKV